VTLIGNCGQSIERLIVSQPDMTFDVESGLCSKYGLSHLFFRSIGRLTDSANHRPTDEEIEFISNLSADVARVMYKRYFWDRYKIDLIRDEELQTLIFRMCVNMGAGETTADQKPGSYRIFKPGAITHLQTAINWLRGREVVPVSGLLDENTAASANNTSAKALIDELRRRYAQSAAA
jgi:hypothetical protein